jgi:flagellar biosynthesis/type III secretory pathway protein FliH
VAIIGILTAVLFFVQQDQQPGPQYTTIAILGATMAAMVALITWWVKSMETRAARNEEAQRERQAQQDAAAAERATKREEAENRRQTQWLEAYTKATEAHVSATATLAIVIAKFEAHDLRMQEEHKAIMAECFTRRGIGEK